MRSTSGADPNQALAYKTYDGAVRSAPGHKAIGRHAPKPNPLARYDTFPKLAYDVTGFFHAVRAGQIKKPQGFQTGDRMSQYPSTYIYPPDRGRSASDSSPFHE